MNFLQELMLSEYERAEKLAKLETRWQLEELNRERKSQQWQKVTQFLQPIQQRVKFRIRVSFEVNEPCPTVCNVAK